MFERCAIPPRSTLIVSNNICSNALEYLRRVGASPPPSLPMAELCKKLLYLRAQFNMPDLGRSHTGAGR